MNTLAMVAAEGQMEAAGEGVAGWFHFILANPLAFAILLIFTVAIIGAFVAARKRDRCLKKFRGYPVTVRFQNGKTAWGRLRVFSKGLELRYDAAAAPANKRTYLLYEPELGNLLALYRFLDRLEGAEASRRARQVRLFARSPLVGRLWRGMRNVINTFRDAGVQALGLTLQQAAKAMPAPLPPGAPTPASSLGAVLGAGAGRAYEPMLEQYVGLPVALELVNPADAQAPPTDCFGTLGEYSDKYVLLVSVRQRFAERFALEAGEARFLEGTLRVRAGEGRLLIENASAVTVTVDAVQAEETRREINQAVPPGETAEVEIPSDVRGDGAQVTLSFERSFDAILPRACGTVRHAAG